ncbi:SusC/RagA family TonB-linked outer membrane protein [Flexithrix dorotheae]|uniref:SusC/RagA family TonB-linked outer membrane protein n=1 Tax=Flexithrix dorotheae TaxID=70993 RepID=UPI00146A4203|nr:TonB-dependent receptor [Flexithrix dorotheae]
MKLLRQIKYMSRIGFYGLILQLTLFGMISAKDGNAQYKVSMENVYVSIDVKEKLKLKQVFVQIENKTGFGFSYSKELVDENQRLKSDLIDGSVANVLRSISKETGLTFKRINENIYVTKRGKGEPKISEFFAPEANQLKISGTISSSVDGEPLPGVSILIKGTSKGTTSNFEGHYTLIAGPEDILQFSFIGYKSQELLVGNQTEINLALQEDLEQLDEVVVIGYGTAKKKDLTGSISTLEAKDLVNANSVSPQFALQGNVSGVRVINASGDPNEAPRIFVRGIGTWNGDSQPLYVIDGQIFEPPRAGNEDEISGHGLSTPPNLFNMINPSDIESMTVLKDASASAIYGSRGANGVILITTKKGKKGRPVVEFNSRWDSRSMPTYSMLNTQQYVDLTEEMFANNLNPDITIGDELYGNDQPDDAAKLVNRSPQFDPGSPFYISDRTTYNHQDELLQNHALSQNYDLKISGATDIVDYYVSGSYLKQENLFKNNNLERYTGAFNINVDVTDWLKTGVNYKFTWQRSELNIDGDLDNFAAAAPWQPIFNANDPLGFQQVIDPFGYSPNWQRARLYGQGTVSNTLALSEINTKEFTINRHIAQLYAEFKPIYGLTLRGSLNLDYSYQDRFHLDVWSVGNYYKIDGDDPSTEAPNAPNSLGGMNDRVNKILNYQADFTATYTNTFAGKHNMTLTGVVQDQRHVRNLFHYVGNNLTNLNDDPRKNSYGNDLANNSSFVGWNQRFWFGFAGRASYSYESKYYIDASIRRDASNGFDDEYRWGTFYSLAGAWRVSDESFFSDVTFINDLKLRGGWGEAGNDQAAVGSYAFLSGVNTSLSSTRWGSGMGDAYGNLQLGALVNDFPNSSLSWEIVTTSYAGFDALLLNNKLNVTFEWFNRKTSGILQRVNLPLTVGTNSPLFNIGELVNKGIDLAIGYNNKLGDFTYGVSGNISFLNNEVTKLYNSQPLSTGFGRVEEGRSVGHIWAYKLGGIFQNQAEIDNYFAEKTDETIGNVDFVAPGDMYFLDVQGNPTEDEPFYSKNPDNLINSFDQTEVGKTIPGFTYGANINLGWKGFDFFAGFYGEGDVQKYNSARARFENMAGAGPNYTVSTLNRWTLENPNTDMPRAVIGDPAGNNRYSNRYVESAAFFRLNNWQIGYSLPESILNGLQNTVQSLRIYIGGQNNLYWNKWSSLDPVNDAFPLPKTYSVGLNARF